MDIKELLKQRDSYDRDSTDYSPSRRAEVSDTIVDILLDVLGDDLLCQIAEAGKDRVVVLPCKVGDTVWLLLEAIRGGWDVVPSRLIKYYDNGNVKVFSCYLHEAPDHSLEYRLSDFGKTVFLTPEAAAAALKGAAGGLG